ncbi:serine protease [Polyangium sp. y55x31]|uniref:serine protease n=1 Tax=Polyangium sp. y55x31 TaxID=3042688 RepID=UPI002482F5B5|nr:serine protease [Polyangium sp. y55x31]MDI1484375.1 serine protease [Polyangium sp. y55x31]
MLEARHARAVGVTSSDLERQTMNQSPARSSFALISMLASSLLLAGWGGDGRESPRDEAKLGESFEAIVGGTQAATGEFPWAAAMLSNGSLICGGVIIGTKTVLTSARCAAGRTLSTFTVRVGSNSPTSGGQVIQASEIIPHPSYSSSTLDYNIAVVKLASAVPSSYVIPMAADGSDPGAGVVATVAGWGRTAGGGALPSTLQKADLNIIPRATCQASWGSVNTITARMLCAGTSTKGTCSGDDGGPLVIRGTDGSYQLHGLVSWGVSSCPADTTIRPIVFTRIGALRSWIQSTSPV